jgi:hypothetical protein
MKELFFAAVLAAGLAFQGATRADDGGSPTSSTLPSVSVTATDPAAFASLSTGAFVVSRERTSGDLNVTLTYSGSASNGVDYATLPTTVKIPDGSHAVALVVQPLNGGDITHTKWVEISIPESATYRVRRDHAAVQIVPNAFENSAPTVSITAPADNTTTAAKTDLTITASASDDKGNPKVSFFANDHFLGALTAPPYSLVWSNVPAGKFALFARAEDAFGKSTVSAAVHVTATNPPVSLGIIKLTLPSAHSSFAAGANIDVAATVTGNSNVTGVAFSANGSAIGSASAAPYSITWSNVAAGSYVLQAKAADSTGGTLISAPIEIRVTNPPPVVTITAPADKTTVSAGANVDLSASATSPNGIANVMFFVDASFVGRITNSPYSLTISNVPPGTHSIRASATDLKGTVGYSSTISLIATNPPGSIAITSPTNNASFTAPATVEIKADAADPNGVRFVVFFVDNRVLRITDHSPYTATAVGLLAGTHVLSADVYDKFGGRTRSDSVTITVQ